MLKSVFFSVVLRLLAEEEEKMKALMALQEEQEEYILKTQREKQELKQEMEVKSRALDEAQRQLEEVRANRHRVDQDVVVRTAYNIELNKNSLCIKTTFKWGQISNLIQEMMHVGYLLWYINQTLN